MMILKKNFPELGKHSCPYFRHKIKTIKVLNQLNLSLDVNSSLQAYLMIKQKPDQRENREGEILCFWDTSRSLGRPSSYSCSSIGGGLKSPDYTDLQTNKTATYHLFIKHLFHFSWRKQLIGKIDHKALYPAEVSFLSKAHPHRLYLQISCCVP